MKKHILLYLTSLLFFMAADANANCCEDRMNFYAKVLGGVNWVQNTFIDGNHASYQTGYIVGGSLGYCWRPYRLRVEAEYAFRRNAIKHIDFVSQGSSTDGHLQASSYMGNLFWDLPLCAWGWSFWNIRPYIGAGIGYDCLQMHASNTRVLFHQKWKHFSWQTVAGFAYPVYRNLEAILDYKFHQGNVHFYNHSIELGLVYKFLCIR